MLIVLASWFWIGISAFLWGFFFLRLIKKLSGYDKYTADMLLLAGLCLLTVYAQIFSLFYKVGAAASVGVLVADIVILSVFRKELRDVLNLWRKVREFPCFVVITVLIAVAILVLSSNAVSHYDTTLYHAQSIRWVEEYGIVPGLGNLHNRLAYNSAIFSLQALFSLRFLIGQSLHSVNGFAALVLITYAVVSMKVFRQKKFFVSDFLRLGIFIYFGDKKNYNVISSPGSDLLALGLVIYIFVKWVSYLEEKERETAPYAVLCLLGVYAVSVKLSAAMVIFLVIMPAVKLVSQKKWKEITGYLSLGILIIAPFLIRNVIISGYLVYPYPELDFFSFDWKMPSYTLLFDRNEIRVWGWGLNDVQLFDASFSEWFPVWRENLGFVMEKLFYLNLVLAVVVLIEGVRRGVRKRNWEYLHVTVTMMACFLLWYFGSPLPRYGSVFMILLPLYVLGDVAVHIKRMQNMELAAVTVMVALGTYYSAPMIKKVCSNEWKNPVMCADYTDLECAEYVLGTEKIYVPVQGDQAGYYAFPATPYVGRLELIELRGDSLKEGFRMKEEYRNAYVSTYGNVSDVNMFEQSE